MARYATFAGTSRASITVATPSPYDSFIRSTSPVIRRFSNVPCAAVLAYHLVHGIRTRLKDAGINCRWKTIAERLERHGRVMCGMNRKGKKRMYIRQCTEPEEEARKIYEALGLGGVPCERRMFTI